MDVNLIELSSPQRNEVRKLFTDNKFDLLLRCIQAECDYLTWNAQVNKVEFLYKEDFDREAMAGFKKASRLAVALEVLREYADEKKQLCTLSIEP
jgi:hypothetical protein